VHRDNGYFGFRNAKSGTYLGHNAFGIRAEATRFQGWTRVLHGDGESFGRVSVADAALVAGAVDCFGHGDGRGLEARPHGDTVWEFVEA